MPLLLALNWGGSAVRVGLGDHHRLARRAPCSRSVAFVYRELHASEPILDVRLFGDRSFSASMIVLFLSGVGMFGSIMFLPLFMQVVQGRGGVELRARC